MDLGERLSGIREKLKWLDPFTYVDLLIVNRVKKKSKRVQITVFILCMIFVSIMLYLFVIGKTTPLPFFFFLVIALTASLYFFLEEEAVDWSIYLASAFFFALVIFFTIGFLLGTNSPMVIVLSGSMEPLMYRGDVIVLHGVEAGQTQAKEVTLNMRLQGAPLRSYATPYCKGESGASKTAIAPCTEYISLYNLKEIDKEQFNTEKIDFEGAEAIDITTDGDIVVYYSDITGQQIIHRAVAKIKALDGIFLLTKGDSINNPLIDQQAGITSYAVNAKTIDGRSIFRVPLIGYGKLLIFDDIPVILFGCRNPYGCPLP